MTEEHAYETKPFDLAIAGELNPDLILYGLPREMPTERDLLGTNFVATLGSSSAIVAHNAATLGLNVQFSTLIGDDHFGRFSLDRLAQAGVDTAGAVFDASRVTGVTILLPHGAERHNLSYLGSITELTVEHLDIERLKRARHFHLSSLYLQKGLHQGLPELLRSLKSAGLTLSLDTNDDPEDRWGWPLDEVLPLIDFFLPSEGELCRMAGEKHLDDAVRIFRSRVPALVIKRGRNGCRLVEGNRTLDLPGLDVHPVDTIGAGDSFDAGFVWALLRGLNLEACARAGNITGALSTLGAGGTEAFRDKTMRMDFLKEQGLYNL